MIDRDEWHLLAGAGMADFSVSGFQLAGFTDKVPAGSPITLYLKGTVVDLNAGTPDEWQILVLVGEVDVKGKLVNGGLTSPILVIKSSLQLYSKTLYLRDASPGSSQLTVQMGVMPTPARKLNLQYELFANHSDSPAGDWNLWQ